MYGSIDVTPMPLKVALPGKIAALVGPVLQGCYTHAGCPVLWCFPV